MKKFILPTIGVIALTAFFSIFIVKEVNQAIVLQFGDPKRILLKPGLNFKLPFIQNVVFLDKRILNLDAPPIEVIASDQKRLIVDAFATTSFLYASAACKILSASPRALGITSFA